MIFLTGPESVYFFTTTDNVYAVQQNPSSLNSKPVTCWLLGGNNIVLDGEALVLLTAQASGYLNLQR